MPQHSLRHLSDRDLLEAILARQGAVHERLIEMSQALANLQAKVLAETNATQALRLLLQGVADELKSALANDDSDALQALSDKLSADVDANVAAVTANTPAAPQDPGQPPAGTPPASV